MTKLSQASVNEIFGTLEQKARQHMTTHGRMPPTIHLFDADGECYVFEIDLQRKNESVMVVRTIAEMMHAVMALIVMEVWTLKPEHDKGNPDISQDPNRQEAIYLGLETDEKAWECVLPIIRHDGVTPFRGRGVPILGENQICEVSRLNLRFSVF